MAFPLQESGTINAHSIIMTDPEEESSILPNDVLTVVLEYVPSAMLTLLEADNGYSKLILSSPNIWKHFNLNLYADMNRIQRNNPLIAIKSILIPNTTYFLSYQTHRSHDTLHNDHQSNNGQLWRHHGYEDHLLKCYHADSNEMIYLNLYISVDAMNDIILNWLHSHYGIGFDEKDKFVPLLIPIEYIKKIRILCFLSHITNTLNYLADYLSNLNKRRMQTFPRRNSVCKALSEYQMSKTSQECKENQVSHAEHGRVITFQTRLQMDMDCFMHSQRAMQVHHGPNHGRDPAHFSDLHTITNLIVDNCDLTRQFSTDQSLPFQALPNVETLTLCCSYVSFYSSTLTTIHSMLFASKYRPFYQLWDGLPNLKSIVISEKNPNRLYNDLRNSRKLIHFPNRIDNLWIPHSEWMDCRQIQNLKVLCLDPMDVFIDALDPGRCLMDDVKIGSDLLIHHLFINITSVATIDVDDYIYDRVHGIDEMIEDIERNHGGSGDDDNRSQDGQLVNMSRVLETAEQITICVVSISVEQLKVAMTRTVGEEGMKKIRFVNDIKMFRSLVHSEMELVDVFDDEYEWMIHNKTLRDQHEQICHLDIIDDILGSITYASNAT